MYSLSDLIIILFIIFKACRWIYDELVETLSK